MFPQNLEASCLGIAKFASGMKINNNQVIILNGTQEIQVMENPENHIPKTKTIIDDNSIESVKYSKGDYLLLLLNISSDKIGDEFLVKIEIEQILKDKFLIINISKCPLEVVLIDEKLKSFSSILDDVSDREIIYASAIYEYI